jgi:hypothetical protein
MNYKEREKLIDELAQRVTDDCPIEALMQHFYNDQYEYFRDLSDKELLDEKIEILGEDDNTCPVCYGTGEGRWDGGSCQSCGGKGEVKENIDNWE